MSHSKPGAGDVSFHAQVRITGIHIDVHMTAFAFVFAVRVFLHDWACKTF